MPWLAAWFSESPSGAASLRKSLGRLAHALAGARHAPSGASADLRQCALGALAALLDRLAGLAEQVAGAFAHLLDGVADAFEQLGVAVKRGQHALEDQGDVVEPRLEQRLRFDPLDLQLHFAE